MRLIYHDIKCSNNLQFESAIEDFDVSLKLEPNQKAFANKGLALLCLKRYSLAVQNFTRSLEFSPDDAQILFFRGNSYEGIGSIDKACLDYQKSNKLKPNKACAEYLLRLSCNN